MQTQNGFSVVSNHCSFSLSVLLLPPKHALFKLTNSKKPLNHIKRLWRRHAARHVDAFKLQLPVLRLPSLTGNDSASVSWQCHITWEPQVWTMGRRGGVSSVVIHFSGWLVINLDALVIYCYVKYSVQSRLFLGSNIMACVMFPLAN